MRAPPLRVEVVLAIVPEREVEQEVRAGNGEFEVEITLCARSSSSTRSRVEFEHVRLPRDPAGDRPRRRPSSSASATFSSSAR